MDEIDRFREVSARLECGYVIAVGVFSIGMEWVVHAISGNFTEKVYMSAEQREFLEYLKPNDDTDSIIHKLLAKVITNPNAACIHVLPVEEITYDVRIFQIIKKLFFAII